MIFPAAKTQSLVDAGIQGQSIKKSTRQYLNNNTKMKYSHSQHPKLHPNQAQSFYSSLTTLGANNLHYQTQTNRKITKNGPTPFLPSVSGASAFSNYSTNTGHSTSIVNKVKK